MFYSLGFIFKIGLYASLRWMNLLLLLLPLFSTLISLLNDDWWELVECLSYYWAMKLFYADEVLILFKSLFLGLWRLGEGSYFFLEDFIAFLFDDWPIDGEFNAIAFFDQILELSLEFLEVDDEFIFSIIIMTAFLLEFELLWSKSEDLGSMSGVKYLHYASWDLIIC